MTYDTYSTLKLEGRRKDAKVKWKNYQLLQKQGNWDGEQQQERERKKGYLG